MNSAFGQVLIPLSGSIVLPIIHSNEENVTVLNAYTFDRKPSPVTISRADLVELTPEEFSRCIAATYSDPTYRYTGPISKI